MVVEEDSREATIRMKNNKSPLSLSSPPLPPSFHYFRLFSYLSMAVLSVAVLVGMMLIIQHLNEEATESESIANQQTLIQNQVLLKQILEEMRTLLDDAKQHEINEETLLGHNTNTNINVSKSNSERLNLILDYLNITIPESLKK